MLRTLLSSLSRAALPLARAAYSARLAGVNGFTGRGAIGFDINAQGEKKLFVDLYGVAGRGAEIFVDDRPVQTIAITKGRGGATFASRKGDIVPDMAEGAKVDVMQNGDVILSGVLTRR